MMTQKKSRIKCPSLGLTLAAHALREALEEQRVILPVTLEELQGLCARERRPRILAGYLRWQREEISRLLARCIVENADTMEAEFLHRHYREGRSIHYLSLHLPASERYLYARAYPGTSLRAPFLPCEHGRCLCPRASSEPPLYP